MKWSWLHVYGLILLVCMLQLTDIEVACCANFDYFIQYMIMLFEVTDRGGGPHFQILVQPK